MDGDNGFEYPARSSSADNKYLKPEMARRSTDPITRSFSPLPAAQSKASPSPARVRTRSPFARSHLRSRSATTTPAPPSMTRSHSMPVVDVGGQMLLPTSQRPVSPMGSSGRYRSPSRRAMDEAPSALGLPSLPDIGENDSLETDFDHTPRASDSPLLQNSPLLGLGQHNTFPRRHRPASPLRSVPQSSSSQSRPKTPISAGSSPVIGASKFNEPYPVNPNYSISFLSNSSMPSTPTSARSRSPSISSLETIPDSPDAEEAAIEAETIARLKAAAEATEGDADGSSSDPKRRAALDAARSTGIGFGFGTRDKRKRWSVCGAERRGDLDLETIWED